MAKTAEIRKLCADFLGEKWQKYQDDINVEKLQVGFCNENYRCSLNGSYPKDVIVKIYGSEFTANNSVKIQGITGETIVFYALSINGIAPKLLAAFDNGRIEEFVYGRNVTIEDFFNDHSLLSTLAKILVKFHSLSMPVIKKINHTDKILKSFGEYKLETPIEKFPEDQRYHIQNLFNFPIQTEIEWALKFAPKVNSKVVFSHHDCYTNNIMLRDSYTNDDDRLVLFDYEMSGYNYRGFDIAFFLLCLGYRIGHKGDKIAIEYNDYLDPEVERCFIDAYLNEWLKQNKGDEHDTYDHLLMETRFFTLIAMLTFVGYRKKLLNSPVMSSQVDSFAFLTDVNKSYSKKKELFVKSYPDIFK